MNRSTTMVICCALSFAAGAGFMWTQQRERATAAQELAAATPVASTDQPATSVTRREPQVENEFVKSWKSIIMPNQPLKLHRHENGRVLIALTGGPLNVVDKDGKVLNTYNWERGKAYWLDADPPGQMHADVNETGAPIEVIVVELQKKQ